LYSESLVFSPGHPASGPHADSARNLWPRPHCRLSRSPRRPAAIYGAGPLSPSRPRGRARCGEVAGRACGAGAEAGVPLRAPHVARRGAVLQPPPGRRRRHRLQVAALQHGGPSLRAALSPSMPPSLRAALPSSAPPPSSEFSLVPAYLARRCPLPVSARVYLSVEHRFPQCTCASHEAAPSSAHATLPRFFHLSQRRVGPERGGGMVTRMQVNVEYVKPVVDNFNDGDCVLVFDLELMLTPTLIGLLTFTTLTPHPYTHTLIGLLTLTLPILPRVSYLRLAYLPTPRLRSYSKRSILCARRSVPPQGEHPNCRAGRAGVRPVPPHGELPAAALRLMGRTGGRIAGADGEHLLPLQHALPLHRDLPHPPRPQGDPPVRPPPRPAPACPRARAVAVEAPCVQRAPSADESWRRRTIQGPRLALSEGRRVCFGVCVVCVMCVPLTLSFVCVCGPVRPVWRACGRVWRVMLCGAYRRSLLNADCIQFHCYTCVPPPCSPLPPRPLV
jgi:hypothetical protein